MKQKANKRNFLEFNPLEIIDYFSLRKGKSTKNKKQKQSLEKVDQLYLAWVMLNLFISHIWYFLQVKSFWFPGGAVQYGSVCKQHHNLDWTKLCHWAISSEGTPKFFHLFQSAFCMSSVGGQKAEHAAFSTSNVIYY